MKRYRKPYRVKRKKPIWKSRFFWLGILSLIILGGIFYLICFSVPFQIKEIKISGNQKVVTENLRNLIEERINQKILFFYSKSIFLANFKEIKKEILKNFPQVQDVNLKRKLPDGILIQIEERKPIAIFNQNEKYFFLDREGIIFEEVSEVGEYLKIKSSAQNQLLNLGERAIEKELLHLILETGAKLKNDLKIPLEELSVVSDERVNFKTLEGWGIYFNPKGDSNWQLTKLKVVLEEEIPQEKRKDLEYIELRFGNFAPYKYRD